jgi:hypothetical protein
MRPTKLEVVAYAAICNFPPKLLAVNDTAYVTKDLMRKLNCPVQTTLVHIAKLPKKAPPDRAPNCQLIMSPIVSALFCSRLLLFPAFPEFSCLPPELLTNK